MHMRSVRVLGWLLSLMRLSDAVLLQTFNTGLMPQIPGYEYRKHSLISALLDKGSDVICLQEVWFGNDVEEISNAVKEVYPHAVSAVHPGTESNAVLRVKSFMPQCASIHALGFIWCVWYNCLNLNGMKALQCGFRCGLMDQHQECISCILAAGTANAKTFCLFGVDGLGSVTCTHMAANMGKHYFEPILSHIFGSWEEQSLNEARQLVQITNNERRAIIMGDLNCGSALPDRDVDSDLQDSYRLLLSHNFYDPYTSMVGDCTYCADNVISGYNKSWILDHILVKGIHIVDAKILYNENIPGHNLPLSDHYSIQVQLKN